MTADLVMRASNNRHASNCYFLLILAVVSFPSSILGQAGQGQGSKAYMPEFRFQAVKGLFVQENASSRLPGPGQHPKYGAKISWPSILKLLRPDRKLLYLIRHGEAVSNAVQATVGELAWASVATACLWKNESSGQSLRLFDPSLTARGERQAQDLAAMLQKGDVRFADLTGGRRFKAIFSPLTRTIQTFLAVLGGSLDPSLAIVDEYCRERFGRNTCDARSQAQSIQDEDAEVQTEVLANPCPSIEPLSERFPSLKFPVARDANEVGLVANEDPWWLPDSRETDDAIRRRANVFLNHVFLNFPEDIVFVVTHSGMISALLGAIGRESYNPSNAELVPALIQINDIARGDEL